MGPCLLYYVAPYYYGLLRTNKILPIQALKSMYLVYIHSSLKYNIIYWGSSKFTRIAFTLHKIICTNKQASFM